MKSEEKLLKEMGISSWTLKKNFSNKDGKIYSTFEIAWLLGWKYDENQPKPLTPGSGEKNLEEAVNELT